MPWAWALTSSRNLNKTHTRQPHGKGEDPPLHSPPFRFCLPKQTDHTSSGTDQVADCPQTSLAWDTILGSKDIQTFWWQILTHQVPSAMRNCPNYFVASNIAWPPTRKYLTKISSIFNFMKKKVYLLGSNLQVKLKPKLFPGYLHSGVHLNY